MPTDPTARDVETARELSPCWYATPDEPGATCNGVGAPDCCAECQIAERIARALATARAEEREALRVEMDRDRMGACACANCTATLQQHKATAGDCPTCGARAWGCTECACYDHSCLGGPHASAGCPHGAIRCRACDDGEADGWDVVRDLRGAIRAARSAS